MTAWNCTHCRATNVSSRCGCLASRQERGEKAPLTQEATMVLLDSIELVLPARKGR